MPDPSEKPARVKGPPVWLDMDQQELDDAYTQSVYAPNQAQISARNVTNSELVRQRLGAPLRLAYGPAEIEKLDIYKTDRPNAPIFVYVHGGAWRNGLARDNAGPAEMIVKGGAHFIALDFSLVQDVGANLLTVHDQTRRAIIWIYQNAASFGGDRDRIYLGGHSSGGHLAGCLLITDWPKYGLPIDVFKGGTTCSGMYDLTPVRLSVRSSYVNFTDETVEHLSSIRHLDRLHTPIIVGYGTYETPEFQRQNREFAAAVKAAGKPVILTVGEGYNHFEMFETFSNPYGVIGREIVKQLQLRV
jgi:arylformamidase